MGEAFYLLAIVNAATALLFVSLVLALFKWLKVGSGPWLLAAAALYADLHASLAFNFFYLTTGERPELHAMSSITAFLGL